MVYKNIHKGLSIFILIFLLTVASKTFAQSVTDISDMDYFAASYSVKYDSLLNSYYFKKSNQNIQKKYQLGSATSQKVDFSTVSDSVIYKRLLSLKTVVPMEYTPQVRGYISMYLKKMNYSIDVTLSLAAYYFPMFEEVFDKYKMPHEIEYLAIIESALNPNAVSPAGATGLWQFMYTTGKSYDLEINTYVDERRDPLKATHAAARYLRDLHKIYDNWPLAIAAYNCGPGNVNKAIARSGGKRSFWGIYYKLPRETRGYIPAYIAATYMMNFYHLHGLKPNKISIPRNNDTIVVHKEVKFSQVSKFVNISVDELKVLNPQYKLLIIPASEKGYALRLPHNKLSTFIKFQDSIYSTSKDSVLSQALRNWKTTKAVKTITHVVRKKETIHKVAALYGVSVYNIKKWNKKRSNKLRAGERLIIYKTVVANDTSNDKSKKDTTVVGNTKKATPATPTKKRHERIAKSDTTEKKELVKDSISKKTTIKDSVKISRPTNSTAEKNKVEKEKNKNKKTEKKNNIVKHKVKSGDNLYRIAKKYNTTVDKIKSLNNLKSDNISIGQTLRVK